MSTNLFDKLVADGKMPRPRKVGNRLIWRSLEVEQAFSKLPVHGGPEIFDADNSFAAIINRRQVEKAEEEKRKAGRR